jgi:hypothetical protein
MPLGHTDMLQLASGTVHQLARTLRGWRATKDCMLRLVYVSTCAPGVDIDAVVEIMRVAHPRNVSRGVSGMLCWSGEFFLQCLEGERAVVSEIFSYIARDARHSKVELIIAAPTNVRWFGEWGMGFSRLMASHQLDLREAGALEFDPYQLQAVDLEATFQKLSQHAQRLQID